MARDKKPFEGNTSQGFCILNAEAVPDLWTNATFINRRDAQKYMDDRAKAYGWDLSEHQIVPCVVSIRIVHYEQSEA